MTPENETLFLDRLEAQLEEASKNLSRRRTGARSLRVVSRAAVVGLLALAGALILVNRSSPGDVVEISDFGSRILVEPPADLSEPDDQTRVEAELADVGVTARVVEVSAPASLVGTVVAITSEDDVNVRYADFDPRKVDWFAVSEGDVIYVEVGRAAVPGQIANFFRFAEFCDRWQGQTVADVFDEINENLVRPRWQHADLDVFRDVREPPMDALVYEARVVERPDDWIVLTTSELEALPTLPCVDP